MPSVSFITSLSSLLVHATCWSPPHGGHGGNPGYQCPSNPSPQAAQTEWSGWGANIYNNRWASNNTAVTASSAQSLTQHCRLMNQSVSATPVVNGDIVYYPTWDGHFVALNYVTCAVQWDISVTNIVSSYAPIPSQFQGVITAVSRTSPQIDGNVVYFGTQAHALLVAVDRRTGATLATVQINSHPLAILTMSPTVYNGRIFIGASSLEEAAIDEAPGYQCCSFVGNFAAVDFDQASRQFTIAWNVDMLPAGWTGAAVWGSQPSIDAARSQVFIGTGNIYTLPEEFQACQNQTANITVVAEGLVPETCIPTNVLTETILALDLETGLINWQRKLTPLDAWTLACGIPGLSTRNSTLCPYQPGPDADFGMAPTFVPGSKFTPYGRDIVVVGQKNADLHALSAQAGTPFWSTVTSPDGVEGGLIWGIAVDDTHAYFTAVNSLEVPWTLQPGNTTTVHNSAFGAASLLDGSITWETDVTQDGISIVSPSGVNDVVFFGRTGNLSVLLGASPPGALDVVNKATGEILKEYPLDAIYHGGAAIQDQYVMFGTGYSTRNTTGSFYVWTVDSEQCYGRNCT